MSDEVLRFVVVVDKYMEEELKVLVSLGIEGLNKLGKTEW